MKIIIAAVVGALCGAGWFFSSKAAFDLPCDSGPLTCTFSVLLYMLPALLGLWLVVAWGLLRLARYSPAWPTVLVGTSIAMVLAFAIGLLMPLLPMSQRWVVFVFVPFAGAVGYALAAALTGSKLSSSQR